MNRHGYYEPGRTYPVGQAPPKAGPDCPCCHYWPLETPNDASLMRKLGEPLVTMSLTSDGVQGYWSPEPHPQLRRLHRNTQQGLLF